MDPSNLVELVGMRRLYPLDYTPPTALPTVPLLCETSMMLLIGSLSSVPVIVGREVVRRRKRARVRALISAPTPSRFRYASTRRPRPSPGGNGHLPLSTCPWAAPAGRSRRLCIGRGHVVHPSNRRHHRTVCVVARISSLVDGRRSSPSTRDCTGRCPTLPRPSSGRQGSLVYCPRFSSAPLAPLVGRWGCGRDDDKKGGNWRDLFGLHTMST